jgi:hypothetical protein
MSTIVTRIDDGDAPHTWNLTCSHCGKVVQTHGTVWDITPKRIAAFKWAAEWLDYAQTRLGLGERAHMGVFREMLDESKQ